MGSGVSTRLVCPDDYDEDKFSKIMTLFDQLDKNGDHVVDSSELDEISKLHVKNLISEIEKKKKLEQIRKQKVDAFLIEDTKKKQEEIQKDMESSQVKNDCFSENRMLSYEMEIGWFNRLTQEEREKMFLTKISDKKGHTDFWKFFEYMKNRTDDIQNIVW